ncbi:MAG: HAD family phosphatase [Clostridiales bacterium]|nr:HAD family phosphatase [Clostridiales bacterium]
MKIYLFDFDGTLADSMPAWENKLVVVLKSEGITPPEDLMEKVSPLGDRGASEYLIRLGVKKTVEEINEQTDGIIRNSYETSIPLKKGVLEFLQNAKKQGIYMAVLTASPHRFLDPCLKRTGAYDLFENIWSIEDFGSLKKNQIEIYQAVAQKMNCQATDIVFFDDNIIALQTAKKAGCKTVGVFDKSSASLVEKIKKTADKYIYSFEEM